VTARALLVRRARAAGVVLALVLTVFAGRLVEIQVGSHAHFSALSTSQLHEQLTIPAARGGIYDRDGQALALSVEAGTVVADPLQISDPARDAGVLAPVLSVPVARLSAELHERSGFVYLAHRVSDAVAARVRKLALPGITLVGEAQTVLPDGLLAEPVLGTVGTSGSGLSGLEYQYNRLLAGQPSTLDALVTPGGVLLGASTSGSDRTAGFGLELTIDSALQLVVEEALGAEIAATHATGGDAVVMDVRTGQILALADLASSSSLPAGSGAASAGLPALGPSAPTYALPGSTLPAGVVEAASPTALTQVYEPGSVFKLVTFSAALTDGIVTPGTILSVPGALPLGGYTFHDAESHGTESLTASQILAQSSNIGTIEIAQRLGAARLAGQIGRLGFGKPTGLDFPGSSIGLVPAPSTWTASSIGSTPIGQADGVTALQVLDAYNAVANGGVEVAPSLVRAVVTPSGAVRATARPVTRRVISASVDAELVQMFEGVVAGGTGIEAAIDGYEVAGKTGTAQIPDPNGRGYLPGAFVGSFVGFAPANAPVLSAIVVLDHPTPVYGGAVAAPVFSSIMGYALRHYGIHTTAAPTAAVSPNPLGGRSTISVPAIVTTEGP
jgi:cell division protein FtsI (penicillin-binding protein 3)